MLERYEVIKLRMLIHVIAKDRYLWEIEIEDVELLDLDILHDMAFHGFQVEDCPAHWKKKQIFRRRFEK